MLTTSLHQCIKCGGTDIFRQWHGNGSSYKHCGRFRYEGIYCKEAEHLYYYCRGCGYEWQGPTLDQSLKEHNTKKSKV